MEHNRGVSISATLTAVPLSQEIAAAKGIKRHADKIILPARLSNEFMKQNAHELGVSFWRVSARDGRSTAATVLEFSAPDGVVMLPPKVVHSLWGLDVRLLSAMIIKPQPTSASSQRSLRLAVLPGMSQPAARKTFTSASSSILQAALTTCCLLPAILAFASAHTWTACISVHITVGADPNRCRAILPAPWRFGTFLTLQRICFVAQWGQSQSTRLHQLETHAPFGS